MICADALTALHAEDFATEDKYDTIQSRVLQESQHIVSEARQGR